jgi:adenylate kinase
VSLSALIKALHEAGLRPTGLEIAEALWLAQHLAPPAATRTGPARPQLATSPAEGEDEDEPVTPARSAGKNVPLGTTQAGLTGVLIRGHPVGIPGVPGLQRRNDVQRALRPLRRYRPSPHRWVIDEDATVTFIADTGLWAPVMRPERERWFDAVLVVDSSPSMSLWQPLAADLRAMLSGTGAFRDVRTWELTLRQQAIVLRPGGRPGGRAGAHSPRALIDGAGRRLFLVLTDGAARWWHDGSATKVLADWGKTGPVAILQPLPEQMWRRTGLPTAPVLIATHTPGARNNQLRVERRRRHLPGISIPVLGVEPDALNAWARLISGSAAVIGLAVTSAAGARRAPPDPLGRGDALEFFKEKASPQTYKLAVCLSAVPLTLPIMRLVQHSVAPASPPSALAEVITGGLLAHTGDGSYEFLPGVRDALFEELRRSELIEVLTAVSDYIAQNAGRATHTFAGIAGQSGGAVTAEAEAFAWVPPVVAARLGLTPHPVETIAPPPVFEWTPPYLQGPHIVLLGPPGAGKGTQAQFIAAHLTLPRISTGDIFRYNVTNNTDLGRKAREFMERGNLVPDEVTVAMVRARLMEEDTRQGFLLDGFPANVPQAETLRKILASSDARVTAALELVVDEDEVIRRLSGRRTCRRCERVWHVLYDPPVRTGICDDCGGELFQRDDDSEEVIRHRLEVYFARTAPLVSYYADEGTLIGIDATGPIEEITTRALVALRPFVGYS